MRTASSALLFSAAIGAPAFANSNGAATSRPEVATDTQASGAPLTQVKAELLEASHRVMNTPN